MMTSSESNYRRVVLVNIEVADLEGLCEKAREAARKFSSGCKVKPKNEAVLFCFESGGAAWAFETYCYRKHIPYRSVSN
jgi:hypothetical protein